jgi:hypothetical protein
MGKEREIITASDVEQKGRGRRPPPDLHPLVRRKWKAGGGVTLPTLSPHSVTLPPHRDAVPQHTGSTSGKCRPNHPRVEGGQPTSLPRQLLLAQVTSDRKGDGGYLRMRKWEKGVSDSSARDPSRS